MKIEVIKNLKLEELPIFVRQAQNWADEVIEVMKQKTDGEGILLAVPDMLRKGTFTAALRQRALRSGFNLSIRFDNEKCSVIRTSKHNARRPRTVTDEVVARVIAGETFASIAESLSVSRQRVEQIVKTHETFSSYPVGERVAALNKFIQPYLDVTAEKPGCLLCEDELNPTKRRLYGICANCRKVINSRLSVASRLRSYKTSGKRHYLSQALLLIRRHNMTPEDIKRL